MPIQSNMHTAKIYQFPTKTADLRTRLNKDLPSSDVRRVPAAPSPDFGGGWYHDAAIQAERSRKP